MFTKKVDPKMEISPQELAKKMWGYWMRHVDKEKSEELYRIYFYDCPPLQKIYHHPITNKQIDYSKSNTTQYKKALHEALLQRPFVAMRTGHLSMTDKAWGFKRNSSSNLKKLFRGDLLYSDIQPEDIIIKPRQKGVDMKLGIDITSVVLKKFANKIVLISGDSDFVPAAKLARTEGAHFILDAMGKEVKGELSEHIDGLKSFINQYRHSQAEKLPES